LSFFFFVDAFLPSFLQIDNERANRIDLVCFLYNIDWIERRMSEKKIKEIDRRQNELARARVIHPARSCFVFFFDDSTGTGRVSNEEEGRGRTSCAGAGEQRPSMSACLKSESADLHAACKRSVSSIGHSTWAQHRIASRMQAIASSIDRAQHLDASLAQI
jgi:hypothetical protein